MVLTSLTVFLLATGADEVIPAEFQTSIELFSRILHYYHMPKTMIGRYADRFRKDHYQLFIRGETPKRLFHDTIALMPDVDHGSYIVQDGSPAINSSIKSLDIQNVTGAYVVAVRRNNKTMLVSSDLIFQKGDIIFLIGDDPSLKKANNLFFRKRRNSPG